jgi:hypothetical protein
VAVVVVVRAVQSAGNSGLDSSEYQGRSDAALIVTEAANVGRIGSSGRVGPIGGGRSIGRIGNQGLRPKSLCL